MKRTISVVIPCFNEEANIQKAYGAVVKIFKKLPKYEYEIVFSDNCSTDKSPKIMKDIAKKIKE